MFFLKSFVPRWLLFLFDLFIVFFSTIIAYQSRFNFNVPSSELPGAYYSVALILVVRALLFVLFGTYRFVVRYTSTHDAIRIGLSLLIGSAIMVILNLIWYYFSHVNLIPYSIILIEFNISLAFLLGYRIILKIAYLENKIPAREKQWVVIFGAGESGVIAKRAIERDAGTKFRILAFIDEDKKKIGNKIEGIPVHPLEKLQELLNIHEVKFIIIAVQKLKPSKKKQITEIALQYKVKVLVVPPISRWINGELSFKQIKKIPIEELLERDEIRISNEKVFSEIHRKTILITGVAGSIGSELVRQVLKFDPLRVICVDIAETPMFFLQNDFKQTSLFQKCEFIIGNILDENKMRYLFEKYRPQIVFHAAAYKHVPLMEANIYESFKTNVLGTKLIADFSLRNNVEKFIFISTDKAVKPASIMGASKRLAEMYIQALNNESNTRFIAVRFGNVLGSNGSVIPLFRKQIESGGPVTITDPEATRYFMTIPEACLLVLEAATMGKGGEIFLLDMGEPVKIIDIAKKMIKLSGLELGKDIQIQIIGLRPGEKLHEELLADKEKTIPTYHESILIAQHYKIESQQVKNYIKELELLLSQIDEQSIYEKINEWIPEFQHSTIWQKFN